MRFSSRLRKCFQITGVTFSALMFLHPARVGQVSEDPGFVSLFDGKSLNGWKLRGGHGKTYLIEEGSLVCPSDADPTLFTENEYTDFVLRFEFRMELGANNGIGIRAPIEAARHGKASRSRFWTTNIRAIRVKSALSITTAPFTE